MTADNPDFLTETGSHTFIEPAYLFLLEINSTQLDEPIYIVNNNEEVVSRGITYEPFPFEVVLPPDDGSKPQNLKLVTFNVHPDLIDLIRQTVEPPTVKLELVTTADLDFVEKTVDFMTVVGSTYDALNITFDLASSSVFARAALRGKYTQTEFPGLFFALQ
jgi:hypothetical protein